ncbi:MACPF domain-containing protein At4g24290-like isoform X2 [Elaeis guineensis]|uniref:MACPF domain-containing protein At4g24290-like isoform X2 n=2 Tax=Elaeis guineensis var. tenera TaxID=51953 RepID=UPI003C6D6BC0
MALKASPLEAAEIAIHSIGLGYDIADDIRLKYCKRGSPDPCLIELSNDEVQEIVLPGGISIPNVPKSIKCDKGERMRFRSDVLSFQRMSELFNQKLSLSGKIPSGLFNHTFEFSGCWQKDAANTKSLAFDGWFITLYTVALTKSQIVLRDHVKQAVPSSWDPAALARFIEKFGTHVIVGVKMGGKDVIYMRQQHSSNLQPIEVQKGLKDMADKRLPDVNGQYGMNADEAYEKDKVDHRERRLRFVESSPSSSYSTKEDIMKIFKRRGGNENKDLSHYEWLHSVQSEPDAISMSFVPISSLLNGVPGGGFLTHAINLYLRYKPPVTELHQFLEFQLPRQWAPIFGDLPLGPQRKQQSGAYLQFTFMGPKLYVNTNVVDAGKRPVTGLRLYLEGRRSNRLAIHLQHLSSLPRIFELQDDPTNSFSYESHDRKYYEPLQCRHFSHICTAPVESGDFSIVTGAQLHVAHHGLKKVLFLRLHFSTVTNATLVKNPEWEGSPSLAQKSGIISTLISTHFTAAFQKQPPRPADVNVNSAVYPGGPPVPIQTPKLLKLIDTTEMVRGPQVMPGYWVVSGAKLHVERGKISLRVKYSLFTVCLPDDEYME